MQIYIAKYALLVWALLSFSRLQGEVYYEGTQTFRSYGSVDLFWLTQFLPYNPVIVEGGAFHGRETSQAAKQWPKGKIFAFEPNPSAFVKLQETMAGQHFDHVELSPLALSNYTGRATLYVSHGQNVNDCFLEQESSLLPPSKEMELHYKGHALEVPCVTLEEWCHQKQIDHIDILKLELEGLELQVLEESKNILKNVNVLIIQSFFHPYRNDMTFYFSIKDFLTKANFVPLAHWYTRGSRGRAVYISKELYDAYFIKCLGLGLGGISLP